MVHTPVAACFVFSVVRSDDSACCRHSGTGSIEVFASVAWPPGSIHADELGMVDGSSESRSCIALSSQSARFSSKAGNHGPISIFFPTEGTQMWTRDEFDAAVRRHDARVAALGLTIWVGSEPTFTDRHAQVHA